MCQVTFNYFYYKRKLTFFPFNIHLLARKGVFIYSYDETVAKKDADEVTSMLHDFFIHHSSPLVKNTELFCDSCAGQNKNYTVFRFLNYMIQHKKRFKSIKVTFPEKGHSYMECNKDMDLINCKSEVNIPSDWVKIFKDARKKTDSFPCI